LESARIAPAGAVDAAIVDVPDRDSAAAQVVGDPVHDRAVGDFGLPAAAVDHQDCGMGAVTFGQPEVDHLQRVVAIADRSAGFRARPFEQIRPDHQPIRAARRGLAGLRHRAGG